MRLFARPEDLLQHLGVTSPGDIDLEAIAWYLGARIKYRPLDGCEARIIGHADRAVIAVNDRGSPRRKRFSIGHELGHWQHHRGRMLICRSEDIGHGNSRAPATEREADQFAANLLMPKYLFEPETAAHKRLTWQAIKTLSDQFLVSQTAAAIRIVDLNLFPAMIVCHGKAGRKWFKRAQDLPAKWFPQDQLDSDSYAFDMLFGNAMDHQPRLMDADTWFDRWDAPRYQLYEQSIRTGDDEVLTILVPKDAGMLDD